MELDVINILNFKNIVNIRFNNILEGFDNYNYIELSPINIDYDNEENFIKTLKEFYRINEGHLIVDFYKNKLNDKSIKYIKSNLSKEDNELFDKVLNLTNYKEDYYKINNEIYIDLLTKLCTRELFFITFYFYKDEITVWGNYNMKFPLFYCEDTNINEYIRISKINKLY